MLATDLASEGWTLRSGGAEGADAAFERGLSASDPREIYLPWRKFNNNESVLTAPSAEALVMAEHYHPAWERCSPAARKLMARNMHQVLGADLATPVEFVVCWTPQGSGGGGTGQALRLANDRGIPVFDYGHGPAVRARLVAWLEDNAQEQRAGHSP